MSDAAAFRDLVCAALHCGLSPDATHAAALADAVDALVPAQLTEAEASLRAHCRAWLADPPAARPRLRIGRHLAALSPPDRTAAWRRRADLA